LKFKSLKIRILSWFIGITALLLVLFSFIFYYTFEKNVYSSIEKNLYENAIYIKENLGKIDKNSLSFDLAILENDKILEKSANFDVELFTSHLNKKKIFFVVDNGESFGAFYFYKDTNTKSIIIYQKEIDDKIEDIVDTMLVVEPLLLLALIILGNNIINKILIPINELTKISKEISISNFSRTIPEINQENEIKNLVDSFNDMIIRLQEGVNNLDRFNSDVSHELRTPLTVIRGEIDITLRKIREPEYYIKSLNTISYESKQIEKIVENLLLLTKYTKENIAKSFELTNIDTILIDTIYTYDTKFKEKNIKLNIKKIEAIKTNANPLLIRSIFSNLIDNAIKYTPNNKSISIELFKTDKIHFLIEDEGIGIDKNKLSLITNRFYRIDESRNKRIEGFGLGLSIVKNSVELHQGRLIINSEINKGTVVEIIL
jgi:signal transduction histidine kinase